MLGRHPVILVRPSSSQVAFRGPRARDLVGDSGVLLVQKRVNLASWPTPFPTSPYSTSTMKTQACDPCAKRKVRCDREEPVCSNCKRRKHDHCSYPEASPVDRIKRLEAQVRSLGGDPSLQVDSQFTATPTERGSSPARSRSSNHNGRQKPAVTLLEKSGDPVVLEEDGQPFYLES